MDPYRSTDDSTPEDRATIAAVRAQPHPEWGESDLNNRQRVEPGWVVATWALCLLATLALAALITGIVSIASSQPITGETNTELGIMTLVAAMSTFIGFAVVLVLRLTHVAHDRLVNSMAVGILHVVVAAVLFGVELALQAAGSGVGDVFEGPWTDEIGNAFSVLERSAAASILACLVSVGMVPARGERPVGTQREAAPQDYQL